MAVDLSTTALRAKRASRVGTGGRGSTTRDDPDTAKPKLPGVPRRRCSAIDPDDTHTEGATVAITDGFAAGDQLVFANQNGISGSYNAGTGVLTLTGQEWWCDLTPAGPRRSRYQPNV